jgi:pyrroline-5-carboxylate reductase
MRRIGIIGFGNMGSCIGEKIRQNPDFSLLVFDKERKKLKRLADINIAASNKELVQKSEVIILAVKPQDFEILLGEIKPFCKDKLIISIAAGRTTNYIEKYLGVVRIIRVMPSLPALVGKGMSCLFKGKNASEDDLAFTQHLFNGLGQTIVLDDENMIDVATAVSGSGPGFLCEFIKLPYDTKVIINFESELASVAEQEGFDHTQANLLAYATTSGTLEVIKQKKITPEELQKQVASKGGTTAAGLEELKKGKKLGDAVKAALKRARELSK